MKKESYYIAADFLETLIQLNLCCVEDFVYDYNTIEENIWRYARRLNKESDL